ncbi:hypothetical protein BG015_006694 [Linnemannia schmuckeri]|uniref:Uncharacterized protein n=1 Tax=Linnemannia schmuckeri TaxID=64567 RepID=A0A9P5S070_9FUNG|nr:hypothetical protein BG015_006694 [Linnemannia schmuckeri]
MDPLSQLPQECLQLVFRVFAQENDTATLAALLRTTKHIASLALPFLYRDPFKEAFHHKANHHHHCLHNYDHHGHHGHHHGHYGHHHHHHDHHDHDHHHDNSYDAEDEDEDEDKDEDMEQGDNNDKDEDSKEEVEERDGDHPHNDKDKDKDEEYRSLPARTDQALARMLLNRLPANTLPPVISLALSAHKPPSSDIDASLSTTPSSPLNYTTHIRNFDLPTIAMSIASYWPLSRPPPTGVANYMQGAEFAQICRSACHLPAYIQKIRPKDVLLHMHYEAHLYREACWALAGPILEQLQSLTLPVSDLGRYSRAVQRLRNLERLHFSLDKVVDYDWDLFSDVTLDDRNETKARRDDLYQAVVQFVEDHTRYFPGRLKTVTFSDSGLWPPEEQSCPEETERVITQLLPPLHNPTSLNQDNLPHFAAHLDSTDLSHVREIVELQGPGSWYRTLRNNRQFLQRCRSLQSLFMEPLGPGAFTWAVQEKREFENGQGAHLEDGLVPLKNVYLKESEDEQLTDELNDIAVAFSQTLRNIIVAMSPDPWHSPQTMNIGQGWVDLPALKDLMISATRNRLVMDSQLLQHCPNLASASFTDHTSEYQWEEFVPCRPAELPKLEALRLTKADNTGRYFIPEPETLERTFGMYRDTTTTTGDDSVEPNIVRPLWTWDWRLPNLHHLSLSAEFAYMFKFRMLQGCPALRSLDLNMETSTRGIARVISNNDMFLPGSSSNSSNADDSGAPKQQALIVPSLRVLSLRGNWRICDESLVQFMSIMFPNLESLEEQGLSGYSLKTLVDVVSTKRNGIAELVLSQLPLFGKGAEDVGLQLFRGGGLIADKDRSRVVLVQMALVQYFFLKDASAMLAKV